MMKRMILAAFAVAVGGVFMSDQASAQCGYGGGGYYGGGVGYYGGNSFYGGGSGLSIGYNSFSPRTSVSIGYNSFPSYGYPTRTVSSFRTRGHYDYHPTSVYRHGNHLHVQPGHYDYHRGRHHR